MAAYHILERRLPYADLGADYSSAATTPSATPTSSCASFRRSATTSVSTRGGRVARGRVFTTVHPSGSLAVDFFTSV